MAVHIRLARHGAKKSPFYRVVITDQRNARDGRFIETVGTYNPTSKPEALELNQGRIDYWKSQGAQASATVERLIKKTAAAAPQA